MCLKGEKVSSKKVAPLKGTKIIQETETSKSKESGEVMLQQLCSKLEKNTKRYISHLSEAVAIPSISADLKNHLDDIVHMMQYTCDHIHRLGGTSKLMDNPKSTDFQPLPPILLAEFISDPDKKTVCVYGHLDVQPASKSDGWKTDPFVLTEKDGQLFGRGATDDKGPILAWLAVVEAYMSLEGGLPVNLKFILEGMEESGSVGIFEAIASLAKPGCFLHDVDYFCISDNYWLGKRKPCLTYGLRGMAYFKLSVKCAEQDLHSGNFGGTIHESMTDLIKLLSTLVDSSGKILVDGVMDDVSEVTPEEEALYDALDFDIEAFKEEARIQNVSNATLHPDKKSLLMARWRYPTLSIHGIEGAFSGIGAKTVIPSEVHGKFSLRLVPGQDPKRIQEVIETHLQKEFAKIKSPNQFNLSLIHGAKAWISDPKHDNYQAGAKAIEKIYGIQPDYTRSGGSIPITSFFQDATQMNVMLLPIGACDDMAHSQNEKINITNFVNGMKVMGSYLYEISQVKGPKPSSRRCDLLPISEIDMNAPGAFMMAFQCKCNI